LDCFPLLLFDSTFESLLLLLL